MEENSRLQQQLEERFRPANIIGNSRAMQEVFDLIAQVSKSEATVLIRGGKRYRKGTGGPRNPLQQPAGGTALYQGQLRRSS